MRTLRWCIFSCSSCGIVGMRTDCRRCSGVVVLWRCRWKVEEFWSVLARHASRVWSFAVEEFWSVLASHSRQGQIDPLDAIVSFQRNSFCCSLLLQCVSLSELFLCLGALALERVQSCPFQESIRTMIKSFQRQQPLLILVLREIAQVRSSKGNVAQSSGGLQDSYLHFRLDVCNYGFHGRRVQRQGFRGLWWSCVRAARIA